MRTLASLVRISIAVAAVISTSQAAEKARGRPFPFPKTGIPADAARANPSNRPKCECYLVSGPDPGYFQEYRFWDFRSVPLDPELAKDYQFLPVMKNATSTRKKKEKYGSSKATTAVNTHREPILLSDTPFAEDWAIQDWGRDGSPL